MTKRGILIVVSGPSGVGKDTIVGGCLEHRDDIKTSTSATTRSPRPTETHGDHYYFVTPEEFMESVKQGDMLEYAEYNGNYYGTPKRPVMDQLDAGHHVILVIETQGAKKVREICPDALFIFLLPPTLKALLDRLTRRGTESPEDIKRRVEKAKEEIELRKDYDFIIVNDDLNQTIERFNCIIDAAECSPHYVPELLKGMLPYDA